MAYWAFDYGVIVGKNGSNKVVAWLLGVCLFTIEEDCFPQWVLVAWVLGNNIRSY